MAHFSRHLPRLYTHADLTVGDRVSPIRYVCDGERGDLVAPVEKWMLQHEGGTLHVPDEPGAKLQLLIEFVPTSADTDAACDRWKAYHLSAPHRLWSRMRIISGRIGADVLDPEEVDASNSLHHAEPGLCKALNADHAVLFRAASVLWGPGLPDEIVCVGFDQYGLDLRTRAGVHRREFADADSVEIAGDDVHSSHEARTIVAEIIKAGSGHVR